MFNSTYADRSADALTDAIFALDECAAYIDLSVARDDIGLYVIYERDNDVEYVLRPGSADFARHIDWLPIAARAIVEATLALEKAREFYPRAASR